MGAIRTRGCSSRAAPCTGPPAACSAARAPEPASFGLALPALGLGREPRAQPEASRREPSEAPGAREPVARPPPAPFWAAWVCSCFRAGGPFAWGPASPAQLAQPAWRRLRRLWCRLRDRLCRHRLNFIRHFFNSFFYASVSRNNAKETLVPRVFTTLPSTSVSLKRKYRKVMGPCNLT